jgi:NADH-quinone oxidoreductase subunit E
VSAIPPTAQPRGAAAAAAAQAAKSLAAGAALGASVGASAAKPPTPAPFPPAALRAACEELLGRYPTKMAALIPILHLAQRANGGWVSPEVEAGVAQYLGLSDAHVRGVLTFYAMFHTQPRGRHDLWVCRTLTCWLKGAEDLTKAACAKAGIPVHPEVGHGAHVGGTSADGKVSVREMECLGLCERAPAVWIDGEVHAPVTPASLSKLMDGLA